MTRASSIQSSQELRIYNSRGCSSQHTCVMGKGKNRVQLVNASLSSHGLRQDAWTVHFLSSTRRPIIATPSRCNVFVCRSLLTPSGGNTIPVLKFASVILTRSYDVLCRSQVVLELIPAIGIIAFATWGLGPLMHLGRIIFFYVFHSYFSTFLCFIRWLNYSVSDSLYHSPIPHFLPFFFHFFGCNLQQKSDNNWSKSRTNYVMTSYLQPLLLWTGMTLICRALNPVILHSEVSQAVKQRLLNFVQSLSTVLAFAYCLSRLIQQAQKFLSETRDSDNATHMGFSFARKAVYSAVWIAAVSLCMELLGFSTQRWLTAGGLGTVLLTLAGREVFTNFLSSVMIHATRPFVVNEWIQTKIEGYEVSGTVEHVGWWSPTIIRGDDREAVHIPNHKFTVNVVRNLSQKTHWRVKTHLAISHLDVNKIINIVADMRKVLAKNPQIEQQRLHRRVFLDNIDPENQALKILVSCFVKTSHFEEYLRVKEAILLDLLRVISHHRARLATHIRTVQKIYNEADLDNVPFSNTIFTHSGVAANCPLLLIEPSHKINADDKTKASTRSVRTNEEKDAKGEAASTSESRAEPNVDSIKDKVTTTTSDSSTTSNVSAIPKSNPQLGKSLHDNSVQNSSETLQPSGSTGHVCKKKMGLNTEEITPGRTTLEEYSVNESKRSDIPTATSQAKQDVERTVSSPSVGRPPLEENIVLGVALEGSKRTLLIEEEIDPSSFPQKSKELAGSRDGNGSPAGKDKKDGQMPTVQSTSQID